MKKGLRERFEQMVQELEQNKNVKISKVKFNNPASAREIERARRLVHGVFPVGVEEFYTEMDGFELEWEHTVESIKQHDDSDRGSIDLLPLLEVFGEWKDSIWFDFEGGDEFKPVKPCDFFAPEACSAFYQEENSAPDNSIYYHYLGETLYKTNYTFPEYIDRLLASRGYWYWIETLCEELQASPQVQAFRKNMPLIFENYNDALFYPRKER